MGTRRERPTFSEPEVIGPQSPARSSAVAGSVQRSVGRGVEDRQTDGVERHSHNGRGRGEFRALLRLHANLLDPDTPRRRAFDWITSPAVCPMHGIARKFHTESANTVQTLCLKEREKLSLLTSVWPVLANVFMR